MAEAPKKHGGYRPGAGRKPAAKVKLDVKVPAPEKPKAAKQADPAPALEQPKITKLDVTVSDCLKHKDPKVFLLALMNDYEADIKLRADAAKALMPFVHAKIEAGVKDAKAEAAKKASAGKFGAAAPPLRMVK